MFAGYLCSKSNPYPIMQFFKAALCVAVLCMTATATATTPRTEAEADHMASETLRQLTLDEKLALIGGHRGFYTHGIERLKIPELRMADGPQGLGSNRNGHSTAYPATVLLAANWDIAMALRYGRSLGRDCAERGISFILGPAVNIYRAPYNGRNFEYMGEDPYLAARTASSYIKGVQSNSGVAAVVKHFFGNNSEYDRHHVSNDMDERTLHEIYLPAFRAAIQDAGVAAVMSSYNLTDGIWTAESRYVNDQILREHLGFKGLYMSDWEAVHHTVPAVRDGVDLEMPSAKHMNAADVKYHIATGDLSEHMIDRKVYRILRTIYLHALDRPRKPYREVEADSSALTALDVARGGITLLKNRNTRLPLHGKNRRILVAGSCARGYSQGGGSGEVAPFAWVDMADGIEAAAHAAGDSAYYIDAMAADSLGTLPSLLREADLVVVCAGYGAAIECERRERTFELPTADRALLDAVADANIPAVAVINSGGSVDLEPWIDRLDAILWAGYAGQDAGTALGEILYGKICPSGHLPMTWEKRWADNPSANCYFDPDGDKHVAYTDGIFTGYRGYRRNGTTPRFPFGHGLSYTTFKIDNLHARQADDGSVMITATVTNTGRCRGAAVVQAYVGQEDPRVARPAEELKGFVKTDLQPGERRLIEIRLPHEAFAYYDTARHNWTVDPGIYHISLGMSSTDLRTRTTVKKNALTR